MNAKSSSKSRAFAARSGTWSSSTALASPGTRVLRRGIDAADAAGGGLAEGQLVAAGVQRLYGIVGDSLNPVVDAVRRTWARELREFLDIRATYLIYED